MPPYTFLKGTEIVVYLDKLSIETLKDKTLVFALRVEGARGESFPDRKLELLVGQTTDEYVIDVSSFPKDADWENIERYRVVISPESYQTLLESGYTGGRYDFLRVYINRDPWAN